MLDFIFGPVHISCPSIITACKPFGVVRSAQFSRRKTIVFFFWISAARHSSGQTPSMGHWCREHDTSNYSSPFRPFAPCLLTLGLTMVWFFLPAVRASLFSAVALFSTPFEFRSQVCHNFDVRCTFRSTFNFVCAGDTSFQHFAAAAAWHQSSFEFDVATCQFFTVRHDLFRGNFSQKNG